MGTESKDDIIRSQINPNCSVCGNPGEALYVGLKDHLFYTSGEWNFKKCSNPECGLIWLDPMPTKEDIGKAYKNYYTHQDNENLRFQYIYSFIKNGYLAKKYGYNDKSIGTRQKLIGNLAYLYPGRRSHIDFTVMFLHAHNKGKLLEVGCGSGSMLKQMKDLGWQVSGIDTDPEAVKNACRKGLQVANGTLEEQEYPSDYFDAITMSHLVEHVHDPLELMFECHRILKPSGRLVVVTPNAGSLGHKLFKNSWRGLEPPRHLHVFTIPSLRYLAEKAGFKKIRIWSTIHWAGALFIVSCIIWRRGKNANCEVNTRPLHLLAHSIQMSEWALLKFFPLIGTEITMIAEK